MRSFSLLQRGSIFLIQVNPMVDPLGASGGFQYPRLGMMAKAQPDKAIRITNGMGWSISETVTLLCFIRDNVPWQHGNIKNWPSNFSNVNIVS